MQNISVKDHFTYKNKHVILHCIVKIKNMKFIMQQKENIYKKCRKKNKLRFYLSVSWKIHCTNNRGVEKPWSCTKEHKEVNWFCGFIT